MKVIQSLNQNAVLVAKDDGAELVALGKGVGFGKKKGDTIHESAVTKVFALASTYQQTQLLDLIREMIQQPCYRKGGRTSPQRKDAPKGHSRFIG